jgi:hypothetical protein
MTERITARQFHEADGVEDWRVTGEGVCTYFRTGSFTAGARLLDALGGGLQRAGESRRRSTSLGVSPDSSKVFMTAETIRRLLRLLNRRLQRQHRCTAVGATLRRSGKTRRPGLRPGGQSGWNAGIRDRWEPRTEHR